MVNYLGKIELAMASRENEPKVLGVKDLRCTRGNFGVTKVTLGFTRATTKKVYASGNMNNVLLRVGRLFFFSNQIFLM